MGTGIYSIQACDVGRAGCACLGSETVWGMRVLRFLSLILHLSRNSLQDQACFENLYPLPVIREGQNGRKGLADDDMFSYCRRNKRRTADTQQQQRDQPFAHVVMNDVSTCVTYGYQTATIGTVPAGHGATLRCFCSRDQYCWVGTQPGNCQFLLLHLAVPCASRSQSHRPSNVTAQRSALSTGRSHGQPTCGSQLLQAASCAEAQAHFTRGAAVATDVCAKGASRKGPAGSMCIRQGKHSCTMNAPRSQSVTCALFFETGQQKGSRAGGSSSVPASRSINQANSFSND
jgi:hypothetical protein